MSSASSAVTYTFVYTDSDPGKDEDKREHMFIQPHDPDYVPDPMYPEYIPLEDGYVLPAEEQPLPPVVSPTAESPGYVAESDPEEDPEEYEDDETEDDDGSNGDGTGGGDECADGAVHLARRSPAEGRHSEVNGDGGEVGMARSLLTSAWWKGIEA
nr:hypothetical protein [Tanacetum cinerariifolium]